MMQYQTYPPPVALQPYVRYFWSFDARQEHIPVLHIRSFADKYPRLIFQDLERYAPLRNPQGEALPWCYLSGIDTRDTLAMVQGSWSHFGVSFFPHGLHAIFGIPAQELTNEMPDISQLCSRDLAQQMQQAATHVQRIQIISQYLRSKLEARKQSEPLIDQLIRNNTITGTSRIADLPALYNISERQLERRFKTAVGISIKKYQRILRFEQSLQLLADASYSELTSVAYQLNYADQSHFIKDFKAFSGMSPYEFTRNPNLGSESSSFIYIPDNE